MTDKSVEKDMEEQLQEIAKEIDAIREELGPLLRKREHYPAALALTLMAAHHVLHDGGGEEDFVAVCKSAWQRSKAIHDAECQH